MNKIALAIHGGAGTILKSLMTAETENEYRNGLQNALAIGWKILQSGGSSLDTVEASVVEMENNPIFNAGRGAVFTHDEKNEMDACIMDGKTHNSGAVAFVKNIKNPIKLARLVMEKTEHYLLAGIGANEFAKEVNVEFAPDKYFFTEFRYQQLLEARQKGIVQLDHAEEVQSPKSKVQSLSEIPDSRFQSDEFGVENPKSKAHDSKFEESKIQNLKSKMGTVGAVACDSTGNVAAATSTGGMTNKKFGRIGDTPIIGAGNYADNRTCAVSCTGHGEFFMQTVAAYDVAARMKYKNLGLEQAAHETIEYLREIGGEGGLIAVDARGNVALPFNSEGMYRGFITFDGKPVIEIF